MDDYIFSVNCDERNSGDVHHTISYHFFGRCAKNAGLLLSYEKTGYNKTGPGRMGDLLDHWSVRRLKEAGADGIKILLYYTPVDPKETNDKKHVWVERIGDECRANDIPYFLELVGYEEGANEKNIRNVNEKLKAATSWHSIYEV